MTPSDPVDRDKTLSPPDTLQRLAQQFAGPEEGLIERLRIDQANRWRGGAGLLVEEYLTCFPHLRERTEDLLVLIWGEVLLREERGDGVDRAALVGRFPTLAKELEALFLLEGGLDRTITEHPTAAPACPARLGRYRLLDILGQGGMGLVVRARDDELDRDLAVKLMLPTHAGDTGVMRRFLDEARLMAGLQHPGVPPIHEMGRIDDGRPFFAMKLIRGRTLDDLLAVRPAPAHDLPSLLGIFERVCETLAYAHSQGVLHRDLKPANIMVGAFGEVQVMDWGLAKARGRGTDSSPRREDAHRMPRCEDGTATESGSVLGTPAFMPPEQARGEVDRLDERADVFGLGAVLCVILTGLPPYVGNMALIQAAGAELGDAHARLAACGADGEMIVLARRCLAAEPDDRPRDAGAVADAVRQYRQEVQARVERAERQRAAAEARAHSERRARWLLTALAASVLGAALLGGWAAWSRQRQRDREAQAERERRQAAEAALAGAEAALRRQGWAEVETILAQAAGLLADGPVDLKVRLEALTGQRRTGVALEQLRLDKMRKGQNESQTEGANRAYEELFRRERLGRPSDDVAETVARLRQLLILPTIVAALDDWATSADDETCDWLYAVARGLDPSPWANRFRDRAVKRNKDALERLAAQASVERLTPALVTALAQLLGQAGGDPTALLRRAIDHQPGDFWLNFELGNHLGSGGRDHEAARYLRAALALRPATAAVYNNLALVLRDLDDPPAALAALSRAIALEPQVAMYHDNAGIQLLQAGKSEEAILAFRRALAIDERDPLPWNNLGSALGKLGRLDEARHALEQGLRLAPRDPKLLVNLGKLHWGRGEKGRAEGALRRAVRYASQFGEARRELGHFLLLEGRASEAVPHLQEAVRLRPADAGAHLSLGAALHLVNRHEEALTHLRASVRHDSSKAAAWLALAQALDQGRDPLGSAEAYRRVIALEPKNARALALLGELLYLLNQQREARAAWEKALAIDAKEPTALYGLAQLLTLQGGEPNAAVALWKRIVAVAPKASRGHCQLGNLVRAAGQQDEALRLLRHAVALAPDDVEARCSLGQLLRQRKRFAEAVGHLERGHALGRQLPRWAARSAHWLAEARQEAARDATLAAIAKGQAPPAEGEQLLELAEHCRRHRDAPQLALRLFELGMKAAPTLGGEPNLDYRYSAACLAAVLGVNRHRDAGTLSNAERAVLRKKALGWLNDDLDVWERRVKEAPKGLARSAVRTMIHWQGDEDFAGLRGPALGDLPEAERPGWRALWARVEALRKRAEGPVG